ncbi:neuronal PAS domain-containing protein 3 isoform X2 [Amblyraja radiata]|uniref:neuronal PAS domain-containing protein 3 isoform X2 n=1 Tax=Amblyraja radiata TaxID=386614 RepID=UPI001401F052|nr:neuronal PAS domain-containing protein 3 isoform X2 [Amblyraja radiata]
MIRIFPDFSVQVAAATGGGGSVTAAPGVGRAAAANGTPQDVGLMSYQQRGPSFCYQASVMPSLQALRKEKSRDAARSRRGKENFEFYELAKLLPLPAAITSQLDKASIIRLTISYLKMRDFTNLGDPPWNLRMEGPPPNTSVKALGAQRRRTASNVAINMFEKNMGSHILQSLDGFLFALNHEGRFLYISETVSIYLGLSQVELTGSSVFDYVHPGDHVEMAEQLGMKLPPGRGILSQGTAEDGASSASSSSHSETPEPESTSSILLTIDNTLERSFFIRMKSTLTKRGIHIKSSGFKVIHVTGRLRLRVSHSHGRVLPTHIIGLVVVAHALPPPTINEVRIDCQMFVTKVNMDLSINYCENRISDYMDLTPVDVVGKRCYYFIHAEDVEGIRHSHLDLLNKGQCITKYYRWLQKNGGYIWIQSCATITINVKNANEKNVIWVNYLLSDFEHKDIPMDIAQLPNLPEKTSESSETSDSESDSKENSEDNENSKSDEKGNQSENSDDPESNRKKQSGSHSDHEMNCNDDDNSSSNQDSRDSDDSFENSEYESQRVAEGSFGTFGSIQIKVERYPASESELRLPSRESVTSDSAKDSDSAGELNIQPSSKHQKRKKRRKQQKGGNVSRRRLSSASSPSGLDSNLLDQPQLLSSPNSASVLKIKTEITEPINFDNDSSIWNYPPNREISRNESPYSMTKPPSSEHFPSPQTNTSLHVTIPDSVLTPPGTEHSASRKTQFSTSSSTTLAPTTDPLSPPLSASPREKQLSSTSTTSSVLYTSDLETLQRLQAGNVVLPLVHRVTGTLTATSTTPQRVYTTGTIRYAPAEVTFAMQGNLLPNAHAVNFVDVNSSSFGLEPKTPMEMLYHHVHRINMSGPFGSTVSGASLAQMPMANVFTTSEGLFSTLPFPVYSNGIHTTQTLERKED